MKKLHRFMLGLFLTLFALSLALFAAGCGGKKATLSYEANLPAVRTQADVSGSLPKAKSVEIGTAVTVAEIGITVRGCRFTGWTDGTLTYQAGEEIELNSDKTLRATWLVGYADKAGVGSDIFIEGKEEQEAVTFTYLGQQASFFYTVGQTEYTFKIGTTRYRLVFNNTTMTYEVTNTAEENQYVLYDPYTDQLNFERVFIVDAAAGEIDIVGYSLAEQGVLWAWGTFAPIAGTDEYQLTIVEDNSYIGIPNYIFKMGTPVTRSEAGASYTYKTVVVYDEEQAGTFVGEGMTLRLDGYGYATLSNNGHDTLGTAYISEHEVAGEIVDFKTASGAVTTYAITRGTPDTIEAIGREVGTYQIYDPIDGSFGRQKLVLDGHGGVTILYGEYSFSVNKEAAYGTYAQLPDGNYRLTITEVIVEGVLPDYFVSGMDFRLTTLNDGYNTPIFLVYTFVLAGTFTSADGATLTLDGYGRAVYQKGSERYEGDAYYDETTGLVTVTRSEYDYRIYRIDGNTFREMGQEIGTYFLYDSFDGLDPDSALYLDGEGGAQLLSYNGEHYATVETGTYVSTGSADEWRLTVGGKSYNVILQELFFGYDENYYEIYYSVYIVYNEALAGTYTGADGRSKLVLDGYGLVGVYTDVVGNRYEGFFERAGNLVVLTDGEYTVWKFILSGTSFSRATGYAGIYFEYYRDADVITDGVCLVLDGNGGAMYMTGHGKGRQIVEGTVSVSGEVYTFSPASGGATIQFRLDTKKSESVFVRYNALWAGEFAVVGGGTLVLDGFGFAKYTNASGSVVNSECLVQGSDGSLVVFTDEHNAFRFLLDRDKDSALILLEEEVQGYYYYYEGDYVYGTVRLFLGGDGYAELARYNEETFLYEVVSRGTYTPLDGTDDQFTFTPSEEGTTAFNFKLQVAYDYPVFSMADKESGVAGTYSRTVTILGRERTETLVLDGYGTATYNFFDEDDGSTRVQTGPYTIDGNRITVEIYSANGAYLTYRYVFELNTLTNTFELISAE